MILGWILWHGHFCKSNDAQTSVLSLWMPSPQKEVFDSYGARVSKLGPSGQIQTNVCFYMACEPRMVFTVLTWLKTVKISWHMKMIRSSNSYVYKSSFFGTQRCPSVWGTPGAALTWPCRAGEFRERPNAYRTENSPYLALYRKSLPVPDIEHWTSHACSYDLLNKPTLNCIWVLLWYFCITLKTQNSRAEEWVDPGHWLDKLQYSRRGPSGWWLISVADPWSVPSCLPQRGFLCMQITVSL